MSDLIERLWNKTQIAKQEPNQPHVIDKISSTYSFQPQEWEPNSDRLHKTYPFPSHEIKWDKQSIKEEVSTPPGYEHFMSPK